MHYLNFSKKKYVFRSADGYAVSIPKSGRTWLHFLTQHYHCTKRGIPFTLHPDSIGEQDFPKILYTHDLWTHRSSKKFIERLKGKNLIPKDCRSTKPVLLLTRDLRDVMVSLYFQVTKRDHNFSGNLSQLLVHPVLGAEATVDIINLWWDEWHEDDLFMHTTYENLKESTEVELVRILTHFGEASPDADFVAQAEKFASFENMQGIEKGQVISDKIIEPGDVGDPDSFKVRRGIQGGYLDYMSEQDIAVVEKAMNRLRLSPAADVS